MTPGSKLVSVVIPVRDGAGTIEAQLEALAAQTYDGQWELVVCDNGSTDGTAAVVERHRDRFATLVIAEAHHAAGINVGRNGGVRAASGELIVICDADDIVVPRWLEAHVECLARHDISGGPLDELSLNHERIQALNADRLATGNPIACRFWPYAFGGNCGFHRRVWEAIGGYDEAWVRGSTEVEFCWRAQAAGFDLGFAPDAIVQYRHRATVRLELKRHLRAAKAPARLYKAFAAEGMPRTNTTASLKGWAWLVWHLPDLVRGGERRARWLNTATWRAGHLLGSIQYRTWYL